MERIVYNSNKKKKEKLFKSINLRENNIKKLLEIMEIDLFVLKENIIE